MAVQLGEQNMGWIPEFLQTPEGGFDYLNAFNFSAGTVSIVSCVVWGSNPEDFFRDGSVGNRLYQSTLILLTAAVCANISAVFRRQIPVIDRFF